VGLRIEAVIRIEPEDPFPLGIPEALIFRAAAKLSIHGK
jgi:hypothetical protein